MLKRTECKWGNIDVERPVAARIVREAVTKVEGVVMADSKGRPVGRTHRGNIDKNADYVKITRLAEDTYSIRINVIMNFGLSISAVAAGIIESVRKDLGEYLDFEPEEVEIHVVGLKARSRAIISRDITISG